MNKLITQVKVQQRVQVLYGELKKYKKIEITLIFVQIKISRRSLLQATSIMVFFFIREVILNFSTFDNLKNNLKFSYH